MSGLSHLRQLAHGNRPMDAGLLGTAKLSWSRTDRLSEEDIISSFANAPFMIEDSSLQIETSSGAAIIGSETALFADLYNSRIGRVWRVGDEIDDCDEPVLDVAFDTDMEQSRSMSVRYRWEEHADLPVHWRDQLLETCEKAIDAQRRAGALRARAFLVRAIGNEHTATALLSIFVLSSDGERSASNDYCVIGLEKNAAPKIINAKSKPRRWAPRL